MLRHTEQLKAVITQVFCSLYSDQLFTQKQANKHSCNASKLQIICNLVAKDKVPKHVFNLTLCFSFGIPKHLLIAAKTRYNTLNNTLNNTLFITIKYYKHEQTHGKHFTIPLSCQQLFGDLKKCTSTNMAKTKTRDTCFGLLAKISPHYFIEKYNIQQHIWTNVKPRDTYLLYPFSTDHGHQGLRCDLIFGPDLSLVGELYTKMHSNAHRL